MPRQVDHEQRRGRIVAGLWRIVAADGIDAATVRNVAAEADVSVGQVQHYFSTKDEMLLFALRQVGDELAARLGERIAALSQPARPREVIRVLLTERLPLDPDHRVYVRAMVAWLGRVATDTALADYMREGHLRLRDHVADRLRAGQESAQVPARVAPVPTADALLATADGLTSHVLQGIHDPDAAVRAIDTMLDLLFTGPEGRAGDDHGAG